MQQRIRLAGPQGLATLPAGAWLALQVAALWPHAAWAAARLRDGSDDPLGLAALAMLGVLVARRGLRAAPRAGWLGASLALTAAATLALWALPPLAASVVAAAALGCALAAWSPDGAPRLAPAGLVLLALPLLASLQFYAGYPLRLVTAQASAWALQFAGLDAAASGAAMTVQGRLVIVDAPCSGVQMAWLGYFGALAVAGWTGLRDRTLLARLPLVGLIVLSGNVLRNSLLVALESRPQGLAEAAHQAIGLAVLAAVVLAVIAWTARTEAHDAARA